MRIGNVTMCLAIAVCLSAAIPVDASELAQLISNQISEPNYRHYLDDVLRTHNGNNRGYYGADHDPARNAIRTTFASFGLAAELDYFNVSGASGENVVATQVGTVFPNAQFIVGAHYDSVNNPGADDDASGVAGLLEIARIMSQYPTQYTIKYIAFDLEEWGLYGSTTYVAEHLSDDIRGMVQLDMISWDWGGYGLDVYGGSQSSSVKTALAAAITQYGRGLDFNLNGPTGNSDHAPFEDAGFAACLLIEEYEGSNPCYHQACDSVDNSGYISYDYATDVVRSVAGYLADNAVAYISATFDCNDNGVPDLQEIQANPSLDCNGNSLLDVCEIALGFDCNNNDIVDECDIASGTSEDCQGDGIPDECQPDTCPPSPSPMLFTVAPTPLSTTAITMTTAEATDPTPPVQYYFYASIGAHYRSWGVQRTYTDTGLTPNTSYTYVVQARDGMDPANRTLWSGSRSAATHIETPAALTAGSITETSIEVLAGGTFTNLTEGQSGLYFHCIGAGTASGWIQSTTWTAQDLLPGTQYMFTVKARNQNQVETDSVQVAFSTLPGACPTIMGDVNGDAVVNGLDVAAFVRVVVNPPGEPSDQSACADYGATLEEDIAGFIADLLGV